MHTLFLGSRLSATIGGLSATNSNVAAIEADAVVAAAHGAPVAPQLGGGTASTILIVASCDSFYQAS